MPWQYLLPRDMDDETRSLIWRLLLTLLLVIYIGWSNSKYGHAQHEDLVQTEHRISDHIQRLELRIDTLENTAHITEREFRRFRAEIKAQNLFNLQVRLCEFRDEGRGDSEIAIEYEKQILDMLAEYRKLTGAGYPLKACTGIGGTP